MSLFRQKLEVGIQSAELETQKALNQLPPLLKWLLIIAVLGTLPAYFAAKNISYQVWQKRYEQGRLQAKPGFTNPKAPKISAVSVTGLGQGTYAAAVEVTNENLDLSVDQLPYVFNFYDSEKTLLYSSPPENMFLLPNQTKYAALPRFTVAKAVAFAEFVLPANIKWQKRLSIPNVELAATYPKAYHQFDPQAFVLEGDFTNNSPYLLKQVRLTFILLDRDKKIIGVSRRDENTVSPFQRRAYKQLWPNTSASNLYDIKVFAETNVLDANNLTVVDPPVGSSSDLGRPEDETNNW